MDIKDIYGIPILGNDRIYFGQSEDKHNFAMLEKFYPKFGDKYDLIGAAEKGNKEAKNLLSFLWRNKCYLYWNYKKQCDSLSFLDDFIKFHHQMIREQALGIKSYSSETMQTVKELFQKIKELVDGSLGIKPDKYRYKCAINQEMVNKLCDFINHGIDKRYWDYNKNNIRKIFELIDSILGNENLLLSNRDYQYIDLYSEVFQELLEVNIILPVEGLVSGIYFLEAYHSSEVFKNIVYEDIYKSPVYSRTEAVRKAPSAPSSLKSKLEKYDIGSLRLGNGSKASKNKKASKVIEFIEDLHDYINYKHDENDEDDEDDKKKRPLLSIIEKIRRLPIEMSLFEVPIDDDNFKRCVFFRSELLRHLSVCRIHLNWLLKLSRFEIFDNMDRLESVIRLTIRMTISLKKERDSVISHMKNVKKFIEAQLPQIKYYHFRYLKNEEDNEEGICAKIIRWIDTQYTVKILEVSREQSDHVRQIEFLKPTDKQIEMFKKALIDYRWLFEFDDSWLNEYLGIDGDERIKLDKKVKKFIMQINNEVLVGCGCEPDNIQKILIYQLCASADSLSFSTIYKYKNPKHRRKKDCALTQIIDSKAKPDAMVSIWLNALMRKQFYVNLGYKDLFDITEDCHNLIADEYKRMVITGYFRADMYEKYNKELNKIIDSLMWAVSR